MQVNITYIDPMIMGLPLLTRQSSPPEMRVSAILAFNPQLI